MPKRILAAVTAGLLLGACGGSDQPEAFPGNALDKARELTRREAELDLPNRSVEGAVEAYGTHGDGYCVDDDPSDPKTLNVAAPLSDRELAREMQQANLIIDVYCPSVPRYEKAVGP